jgi:hypothetical protein
MRLPVIRLLIVLLILFDFFLGAGKCDPGEAEDMGGVLHSVRGRGHGSRLHLRTGLSPAHMPSQQGLSIAHVADPDRFS